MAKKTTKKAEALQTGDLQPKSSEPTSEVVPEATIPNNAIADPIGDETDGEAKTALDPQSGPETSTEIEAAEHESLAEAEIEDGPYAGQDLDAASEPEYAPAAESAEEPKDTDEPETESSPKPGTPADGSSSVGWKPRPPAKLERLQKILAQAGVASRRKAEELIEQGRVQVNGKIVTELGTKADAARDHIRVDGKLLQGAERLRYFVLNKPKGFVTTVKDPEGRPTVMQFFEKMHERLYPVGRLDYMSEGLLLVTNDGELANRLTRAAAGVEKTYLVKVAGVPTEDELDLLRSGVSIERGSSGSPQTGLRLRGGGKPGSNKVRTSPARIRQVRQGDNPWYEVVLIEGRNRELRKMFEEIGHFVEKIRRVGYGPLVLDQEPGNLRELDARELELLRKAADGTLRTPKSKEIRRRNIIDSLPPEKPAFRPRPAKSFESSPKTPSKDYRPKKSFTQGSGEVRSGRPFRPAGGEFLPAPNRGPFRSPDRADERPRPSSSGPSKFGSTGRPAQRPAWKQDDRPGRPPTRFTAGPAGPDRGNQARTGPGRPPANRPYGDRPAAGRTFGAKPPSGKTWGGKPTGRPYPDKPIADRTYGAKPPFNKPSSAKPAWSKPGSSARPFGKDRTAPPERGFRAPIEDFGSRKPSRLHIEPIHDSERPSRANSPRQNYDRPPSDRPYSARSGPGRSSQGRSSSSRPFRSEGSLSRPFTTSSGKPRAGGARPSSRPTPSGGSGPRSVGKTGWKPKSNFGGHSKPASGGKSRPPSKSGQRPGGGKKSGPSGRKRS